MSFSPSGNKLAWVGHDSTVSVANQASEKVVTVRTQYLPFLSCLFVTENSLIVAGHDCAPLVYSHDDNDHLTFMETLDKGKQEKAASTFSAMAKFKGLDQRAEEKSTGTELKTVHQNAIRCGEGGLFILGR